MNKNINEGDLCWFDNIHLDEAVNTKKSGIITDGLRNPECEYLIKGKNRLALVFGRDYNGNLLIIKFTSEAGGARRPCINIGKIHCGNESYWRISRVIFESWPAIFITQRIRKLSLHEQGHIYKVLNLQHLRFR